MISDKTNLFMLYGAMWFLNLFPDNMARLFWQELFKLGQLLLLQLV
jgi:hypothetical protein